MRGSNREKDSGEERAQMHLAIPEFVRLQSALWLPLPQMLARNWDPSCSGLHSFPQEDICHVRDCQKIRF